MTVDEMRAARRRRLQAAAKNRRLVLQGRGLPTGLIDAAPVRARVLELTAIGWRPEAIAHLNGAGCPESVRKIAAGSHGRLERKWEPILRLPLSFAVPPCLPGTVLVPTAGASRRIRGLLALGWPLRLISEAVGREVQHLSTRKYPCMVAADWRAVDDVYEAWSGRLGPSDLTRSRSRARELPAPLAWDDVDDPYERPCVGHDRAGSGYDVVDESVVDGVLDGQWRLRTTKAEKVEVVARWRETGRSLRDLESLTGWRVDRYYERAAS